MKEVFNFTFVDRNDERKTLKECIYSTEYLFGIIGESGVGKSQLIKVLMNELSDAKFIYIERKKEDRDTYLKICLEKIDNYRETKITDYIKTRFDIANTVISIGVKTALKIKNIEFLDDVIDLLFNASTYFINKKKEKIPKDEIIYQYINEILKEGNYILIFDDLTNCDTNSIEILLPLLRKLQKEKIIKTFIILTDAKENEIFISKIFEKLDFKRILVKKLPDSTEFMKILNKKMIIKDENIPIIQELYIYCGGNPQQLKNFLTRILMNDTINKITIQDIISQLNHSQIKENISFNQVEYSILFILYNYGYSLTKDTIFNYASSLIEGLDEYIFNKSFNNLLDLNIIGLYEDFLSVTYKFTHDSIFYFVEDCLKNLKLKIILPNWSNKLLNGIIQRNDLLPHDLLEIKARLSLYNNRPELLKKYNLEYADSLLEKQNYNKASSILMRLLKCRDILNENEICKAINIMYIVGDYSYVVDFTSKLKCNTFDFYYIKSKSESMLGKKEEAYNTLMKALNLSKTKDEKLLALGIEISISLETEGKRENAKNKFWSYFKSVKNKSLNEYSLGDAHVLKYAEDFMPLEQALEYLNNSLRVMEKNEDKFSSDCLRLNIGVVLFRQGKYNEAKLKFNDVCDSLKLYRRHESSYALNNLAVLKMIQNDFESAISLLEDGLFWNLSFYTKTAIMCNLAICKAELGDINTSLKLLKDVDHHISLYNLNYPDIMRKFYVNSAFIFYKANKIEQSKKYIMRIKDSVLKTSSQYKLNKLIEMIPEMKGYHKDLKEPKLQYEKVMFDCWIVTLTHD